MKPLSNTPQGICRWLFAVTLGLMLIAKNSFADPLPDLVAEVKSVTFTSDHGVLTDYNSCFATNGGTVYDPRGWTKSGTNNPITHTKGIKIGVSVVLKVTPANRTFDLVGSNTSSALTFSTTGINSTGDDQTVTLTANSALPTKIDVLNESISWTAKEKSKSYDAGSSGPHKIYVLWDAPKGAFTPTLKRVNWACNIAKGATNISEAAVKFRGSLASTPGYSAPRDWNLDSWAFLDTGHSGDCITLAKLAKEGLAMVGIPAQERWSFPTADGTAGRPAVSSSTCTGVTTTNFTYMGKSFNAKLVYTGNNFEAFFTVSDPTNKAYTVFPPGGPFQNQNYYYLQVLSSVTSDQFWVWDKTQTNGTVTVTDWDSVPGAAHIAVPAVP